MGMVGLDKNWFKSKAKELEGYICSGTGCNVDLARVEADRGGTYVYYHEKCGEIKNAICPVCYSKLLDKESKNGRPGRARRKTPKKLALDLMEKHHGADG